MVLLAWVQGGLLGNVARAASDSEKARLRQAILILKESQTGQALMKDVTLAFGLQWGTDVTKNIGEWPLTEFLYPSDISRTDSSLTREIDSKTGEERLRRETSVAIRVDQPLEDVVLDLAHELTHAARSQPIDPYDPDLTAEKYIILSLQGPGGEVDAVEMECRVGLELAQAYQLEMKRCRSYGDITSGPQQVRMKKDRILAAFGALGEHYQAFQARLGEEVLHRHPWLTARQAELVSSTGNAPYPLALLEEYEAMTEAACRNSRKRIHYLKESIKKSAAAPLRSSVWQRAEALLKKRCD